MREGTGLNHPLHATIVVCNKGPGGGKFSKRGALVKLLGSVFLMLLIPLDHSMIPVRHCNVLRAESFHSLDINAKFFVCALDLHSVNMNGNFQDF